MNLRTQQRAHRVMAIALAITALGMLIANLSREDPMTPPGIYVLGVIAVIIYYTSRWAWVAVIGLLVVAAIAKDLFDTPAVSYSLHHPEFRGQLIGTLVKLAGLTVALFAGLAVVLIRIARMIRS